MRYWYEFKDGFMSITHVAYKNLGCKICYLEKTKTGMVYSTDKASASQTCLKYHNLEKATIKYDEMMDCKGAHESR